MKVTDHVKYNRAFWDGDSDTYQDAHGEALDRAPLAWGAYRIPESELQILGDLSDRDVTLPRARGVDSRQEGFCRDYTHLPQGLPDGSQGGVLIRGALDVVEPDHGNIFRDAPAGFAESLDRTDRGDVVEGE